MSTTQYEKDFFLLSLSSDDFFKKSAISRYSNTESENSEEKNLRKQKSTSNENDFFGFRVE